MNKHKKTCVIIAAAGSGIRMGGGISKQYRKIGGKEVLHHSLSIFAFHPLVNDIILVVKATDLEICKDKISDWDIPKVRAVIAGGEERQDSVSRALDAILSVADAPELIIIHDGARPFASKELITRVIETTATYDSAVPGIAIKDTVKKAEGDIITETINRNSYYMIQTPQGFKASLLEKAYETARKDGYRGTDDSSLVERIHPGVRLVKGEESNIKITTEKDIVVGEAIMKERSREEHLIRIGNGFDVHAFAENRKLILGGVTIPHAMGLQGHSDADVLTHALMDAVLGACGFPDIGELFPDTDEELKGISSILLLGKVAKMMMKKGWQLINADIILVAEEPKIAKYKEDMIKNLSLALSVEAGQINIKGTTTEKLGFCGRGEGIAAHAVVLCRNFGGTFE